MSWDSYITIPNFKGYGYGPDKVLRMPYQIDGAGLSFVIDGDADPRSHIPMNFSPQCKNYREADQIRRRCYGTTNKDTGRPEFIEKGFLVSMVSAGGCQCARGSACPSKRERHRAVDAVWCARAPARPQPASSVQRVLA